MNSVDDYENLFADLGGLGAGTAAEGTGEVPSVVDDVLPSSSPFGREHAQEDGGTHEVSVPSDGDTAEAKFMEAFRILPDVRLILEKVRDSADPQEVRTALASLNQRFRHCDELLDNLPGPSLTKTAQLEILRKLQEKLNRRRCGRALFTKWRLVSCFIT